MSVTATTDPAGRLSRALRFADLAIQAGAVPLPISLIPSPLAHDAANAAELAPDARQPADTTDDRQAAAAADQAVQTQPDHQVHAAAANSAIDEANPDAVVRSLQAAVDAVHGSLPEDSGEPRTAVPQALPDAADAFAGHDDGAPAQASPGVPPPMPASADAALPAAGAATIEHDASDARIQHIQTAAAQPAGETLPQASALVEPVLHTVQPVESMLHAVQPVEAMAQTLTATITSTVERVLGGAPVGDAAGAIESTLDAVSNAVAGDSGAVTIPSLGGTGLDALTGLLHPVSAAPGASPAPDSALAGLEDTVSSATIGVPEVLHADQQVGHEAHSLLHLVGSGLI